MKTDQLTFIHDVKKWAIVAMFSDDDLLERLVLKGGNLLDVVYNISSRASVDLDFSLEGEFDNLAYLEKKINHALDTTFAERGYKVFDINLREVPPGMTEDMRDFWGGYKIDFKIIRLADYERYKDNSRSLRNHAHVLNDSGSPKFLIDISKHEYCAGKEERQLENFTIFTYSPIMVVCEKLRAICQQMPAFAKMMKSHPSARARDFLDIVVIADHFKVDFKAAEFQGILANVFQAKRVPLDLLGQIQHFREYHRTDFTSVKDTVKAGFELKEFDFYFDFVVRECIALEALWHV